MKKNYLLLFAFFIMSHLAVMAQQNVNMKFGKPTKEELEMTSYPLDPNADAVELCRLTNVEYTVQTNGYIVDYHEKVRIKVLKPEGANQATVVVPYIHNFNGKSNIKGSKFSSRGNSLDIENPSGSFLEDAIGNYNTESVEDLKAVAYNQVNGKTVKSVMKRDAVKIEKLNEQDAQVTFTVPDVREGTVIEYEYTVHSQLFFLMRDWYAQREIPVAYACLDVEIPGYLIFNVEEHGIQRLVCKCVQGTMRYKLDSDAIAAPVIISTNHYTCVGRDLKAIPKDSYIWNERDYCAGVTADLKSYSLRGTLQIDYARTWDQIDSMVIEDEDLGKHLDDESPLKDAIAQAKIADIANETERAAAVYQLVMKQVKWNGKYAIWPKKTSETLKKGTGTNADINLLIIQSLHEVGLNAYPVVLRSRDMGQMPYNFPSIAKLSTYVVGISPSSAPAMYIDASTNDGYFNVLPEPLLVERARTVAKGKKNQWINFQKLQRSQTSIMIDAELTADGKLTGTQTARYVGLAAAKYRQELREQGKEISFAPEEMQTMEFSRQGEVSNGVIRISPFNNPPMPANPFTASERIMPVELPCLSSENIIVNIKMPEGYTLAQDAQNTILSTSDKGLDGRIFTSVIGDKLQLQYQFNVNKLNLSEKNYKEVKDIFEMLSKCSNSLLEFKKK